MMSFIKTVAAGLTGTTSMTLYSYYTSKKRKQQFREPRLLHKLLGRSPLPDTAGAPNPLKQMDGWLLHYGTGMVFSSVFDRIWKKTDVNPTIPEGAALGFISGLAGVMIWEISFRLHPDPPRVDNTDYYKHLIAAHTVFGILAALGYTGPESQNEVSGAQTEPS